MRSYDQLVSAIIAAIPTQEETGALTQEQLQLLHQYGNTLDNRLYMATDEWKQWRAANPRKTG
ncbi:MAG: hypothetical protein ACREXP_00020 [Steroidobacteraceae bacterium]